VTLFPQPLRESSSRAPVYQEPHSAVTVTASRLSCAMTACA
jgi:hypothetical protein